MSGSLSNAPCKIIQRMIIDIGDATLPTSNSTWPIYAFNLADTKDNALYVVDTEPVIQGKTHPDSETQEHYGLQISGRSTNPETIANKTASNRYKFGLR